MIELKLFNLDYESVIAKEQSDYGNPGLMRPFSWITTPVTQACDGRFI
jgi:hypothetical protein